MICQYMLLDFFPIFPTEVPFLSKATLHRSLIIEPHLLPVRSACKLISLITSFKPQETVNGTEKENRAALFMASFLVLNFIAIALFQHVFLLLSHEKEKKNRNRDEMKKNTCLLAQMQIADLLFFRQI